jgi:hypothetical protein
MLKLINGEIYRLIHKKSIYVYFLSLGVGYSIIAFIRSGGFNGQSIVNDAMNFFGFLPALAGGFLFAAIYTDDLNAKNLTTLVGFGVGKTKIVLAKTILMAMLGAVVFALAPLVLFANHALYGWAATASTISTVYAIALRYFLVALGYSALSGIAVYGIQRATFAMVLYILLSFNIIGSLITVFLSNMVGESAAQAITARFLSGISNRILAGIIGGGTPIVPFIEFFAYVAIAMAASVMAFNKKEMEF